MEAQSSGGSNEKTFEIHTRLLSKLDELVMRRPLLEMSRANYIEIVQLAASAWQASNHKDSLIDQDHPPRMSDRGTIGGWMASVKQFREFLFGLAAQLPVLQSALARGDPP